MFNLIPDITALHPQMTEWRQHLHAHPEIALQEVQTAQFIAEKLESWGIKVVRGIGAATSVVGIIDGTQGVGRSIALRADIDALPMVETVPLPYISQNHGAYHACGHDGHTAMLLGAAHYLQHNRNFKGRVVLIFQPAEEAIGGAKLMVDDGLFEQFPCDAAFAMHNRPNTPVGHVQAYAGPVTAAFDTPKLTIIGKGGHAAWPHLGTDPIMVAAQFVVACQTLVSRNTDPMQSGVVSWTMFHGGDADNVIPEKVELNGTIRSFSPTVRAMLLARMHDLIAGFEKSYGVKFVLDFEEGYPATINNAGMATFAQKVFEQVVGTQNVNTDIVPSMGAEDFAYIAQKVPSCYFLVGQGESAFLHETTYNFNDAILPLGATLFSKLALEFLAT